MVPQSRRASGRGPPPTSETVKTRQDLTPRPGCPSSAAASKGRGCRREEGLRPSWSGGGTHSHVVGSCCLVPAPGASEAELPAVTRSTARLTTSAPHEAERPAPPAAPPARFRPEGRGRGLPPRAMNEGHQPPAGRFEAQLTSKSINKGAHVSNESSPHTACRSRETPVQVSRPHACGPCNKMHNCRACYVPPLFARRPGPWLRLPGADSGEEDPSGCMRQEEAAARERGRGAASPAHSRRRHPPHASERRAGSDTPPSAWRGRG